VVYNDGLRARQEAHAAGLPYVTDVELSARLTKAKTTLERAWLGGVSSVVLQQALADLNAAYRNFFASIRGERRGPKIGPPRFRSRKDRRQAIRFTANARFKILPGGKLRLPKIGDVPVRWSPPLPCRPSSVTVIQDSAGRYFASFVVVSQVGELSRTEPVTASTSGSSISRSYRTAPSQLAPVPASGRKEPQAQAAGPIPQTEGLAQQGQGQAQGRPRPRQGGRRAAELSPPALHDADPRKPSGRRGRPGGQRARTDPAGQIHP
jgi:hypothetical protein